MTLAECGDLDSFQPTFLSLFALRQQGAQHGSGQVCLDNFLALLQTKSMFPMDVELINQLENEVSAPPKLKSGHQSTSW